MILKTDDLYKYSIALKNSGVTPENIDMLERQAILFLFGKDDARKLIEYINANKTDAAKTAVVQKTGSAGFGGEYPAPQPQADTYGDVSELIEGDGVLFSGLRPLLAVLACMNLLSQNRVQVARQNVTKQPNASRIITRRDEADVVQALSFTAQNITYAMDDYLHQEGKNPLGIQVRQTVLPARYSTNTSGRMPSNRPYFAGMSFLPW